MPERQPSYNDDDSSDDNSRSNAIVPVRFKMSINVDNDESEIFDAEISSQDENEDSEELNEAETQEVETNVIIDPKLRRNPRRQVTIPWLITKKRLGC